MAGAACQLVFLNGHFAPELSAVGNLPKGLEICSLAQAIDCGMEGSASESGAPNGIEQHLGRYTDARRDVFAALEYGTLGGWRVSSRRARGDDRAAGPFALCFGGRGR